MTKKKLKKYLRQIYILFLYNYFLNNSLIRTFKLFSNRYYITVIIIRYKLLIIPEFAKEIPLDQKAKAVRKKKTRKALLVQPDAPELNQEAEDKDYYDLDAESTETNVPSISIET